MRIKSKLCRSLAMTRAACVGLRVSGGASRQKTRRRERVFLMYTPERMFASGDERTWNVCEFSRARAACLADFKPLPRLNLPGNVPSKLRNANSKIYARWQGSCVRRDNVAPFRMESCFRNQSSCKETFPTRKILILIKLLTFYFNVSFSAEIHSEGMKTALKVIF